MMITDDCHTRLYGCFLLNLERSLHYVGSTLLNVMICENHFDSPFPARPGPWQKLSNPKDKGTAVVPLPLPPDIRSTNRRKFRSLTSDNM